MTNRTSAHLDVIERPAATLILLRNSFSESETLMPEFLMLERSARMGFAGGAMVFPGGAVDEADFDYARTLAASRAHLLDEEEAAHRIAAIRETLEEAGLAAALDIQPSAQQQAEARARLHAGEGMEAICRDYGWQINFEALVPWARWKPPGKTGKLFDTRFYLADADANGAAHGHESVDNTENVRLLWASARAMLHRHAQGEVSMIYPTVRNVERLGLFDNFADAAAHARAYPVRVVTSYVEERSGEAYLCIPDGHGYPILAEPLSKVRRG